MNFQQTYQLYDYCDRMYWDYLFSWLTENDEDSHYLANEFHLLAKYLERVLNSL